MSENTVDAVTNVKVAVRCRPFNTKENNNGELSCVQINKDQIILTNPNTKEEHSFAFDLLIDACSVFFSSSESLTDSFLND